MVWHAWNNGRGKSDQCRISIVTRQTRRHVEICLVQPGLDSLLNSDMNLYARRVSSVLWKSILAIGLPSIFRDQHGRLLMMLTLRICTCRRQQAQRYFWTTNWNILTEYLPWPLRLRFSGLRFPEKLSGNITGNAWSPELFCPRVRSCLRVLRVANRELAYTYKQT